MLPGLDPEFAIRLLSEPAARDNKYTRGCVGFVTGSTRYPGAALLGIRAAFELEIGMVQYLGPQSVTDLVLTTRPEVVLGLDRARALVIGSGIAPDDLEQWGNLSLATASGKPLVIDAGALQQIDFAELSAPAIITPHAGEAQALFARLGHTRHAKGIADNPLASARELAELTGCVVLLKGSITVIALPDGEAVESGPGSAHLATAGTGDVLAGMIGALLAKHSAQAAKPQLQEMASIALLANQLLSEAAEIAAAKGEFGASPIAAAISEALGDQGI